jgi:hypothetical protein
MSYPIGRISIGAQSGQPSDPIDEGALRKNPIGFGPRLGFSQTGAKRENGGRISANERKMW